jgi:Trk K+ transport system NAD-binding subunit
MVRSQRRLLLLLAALPLLILFAALIYMVGMSELEGETRGFWQAVGFAAETLSTTGYGADDAWSDPLMITFVVILQFVGVFLIFLIFPVYLIPFLEERFESRLPKSVSGLSDHIVIYGYGPPVSSLLDELSGAGVGSVVIDSDVVAVRRLVDAGQIAVFGSLDEGALERVDLLAARTLITNSTDDEEAAVILGARQIGFSGEILALVEDPFHRKPIMLAGATAAFTPRHVLGAALAARASQRVSPMVAEIQHLGPNLQVSEVRIPRNSSLAGRTLAESGLGKKTGVNVIGQWVGGKLLTSPTAEMLLEPDGILVLVGSQESIQRFEELSIEARPLRSHGPFVVAGFGEVGRKVVQLLNDVGEKTIVVDRQAQEGVDVVGDVLDPRTLEKIGVDEAQAAILAVDRDSATMFATVILKDLAPDVPVIARVNRAVNIERIHRAGAEFALSISQVSGQILARRLLGQEAVAVDEQLKVVKVSASGLEGRHPMDLRMREVSGCSIVAVEREEELITEFDTEFRFGKDDSVYICGSSEATRSYLESMSQT